MHVPDSAADVSNRPQDEAFSVQEIARAARVDAEDVRQLLRERDIPNAGGHYVDFPTAVELVRTLLTPAGERLLPRRLFAVAGPERSQPGFPLAASGALHAGFVVLLLVLGSMGLRSAPADAQHETPVRLVFLATPGPGGGGGGGGLRQPTLPGRARLEGRSPVPSPVVVRKKPQLAKREAPREVETPPAPVPEPAPLPDLPPRTAPAPPIEAPVISAPADASDSAGVVEEASRAADVNGRGNGGGSGAGDGTGTGEGRGTGIGPGSDAGTGGGPYRPGSGVTPPVLQHEVKPVYTEEGRRRGIQGEVLMEVVIRADGTIGRVRTVRGLGAGLDERAADAVRQWRFLPARRHGTPVDVLVEVAVEFRIR